MSLTHWLLEASFVIFLLGAFLFLRVTLENCFAVLGQFWRRLFAPWTTLRLKDLGILQEEKRSPKNRVAWSKLLIPVVTIGVAVAVGDALVSPLVLLFGAATLFWTRYQTGEAQQAKVNEDAELAVLQMRSLLNVDHSLLNSLNAIDLPDGTLRGAIQEVASRLQMHQPPEQAATALKNLPGAVTARLAALIANSSRITDEVQMGLFQAVEAEAHRQKAIRSKMRQTLALVRGTIRLLQGVAAAATVFVLLAPDWRAFFMQDVPHRALLTVLLVCAVFASLYFEFEVHQLGRGEAF